MFIVFEGLDGCGKTTQIELLENKLKENGYKNIKLIREPGSTKVSEEIRNILLYNKLTDIQRLFLFLASRNIVTNEQIIPSIKNGDIVICDRYAPSTLAYQGYGKRVADIELVHKMNNLACEQVHPDLVIFIDVPVEECMKRMDIEDEMEKSAIPVYEKIYNGYKQLSKNLNWITIDGTQDIEEISNKIFNIIKAKL